MWVKYLYNDYDNDDDDSNNNNINNNTVFQMVKIGVAWANFVETAGMYLFHNIRSLYQSKHK